MGFVENLTGLSLEELGVTEQMAESFASSVIIFSLIALVLNLVLYLIKAFSVYRMAKTAEIKSPYLCFVPIVGTYTFGKLAQKYRKKRKRHSPKFGYILLGLNIATSVFGILLQLLTKSAFYDIFQNAKLAYGQNIDMTNDMFSSLIPVFFVFLLFAALSLAYMIIHYIALWRIFISFKFEYATAFTVLSVILGVAEPIILFFISKEKPNFRPSTRFDPDFQIEKVK